MAKKNLNSYPVNSKGYPSIVDRCKLLSSNAKLAKSVPGYVVVGLQLTSADFSGHVTCPYACAKRLDCRKHCLVFAGAGRYQNVQTARARKTDYLFTDRAGFLADLRKDIEKLRDFCMTHGVKLAIRLNTMSDLDWTKFIKEYQDDSTIVFYDYTKDEKRYSRYLAGKTPKNYHLTYSAHEKITDRKLAGFLQRGGQIAVIFRLKKNEDKPKTWNGFKVLDGDVTDARFLDKGCVIGLTFKHPTGKAHYSEQIEAM